ncbi:hypothetical protein CU097_015577 [Rhizopus azygosporus]|uniref:mRNA decay factor PAT1 domain-containing protein n=1 Tax=Rhizopus azygosporus TaxID=86630 RepID=A0A367KAY3_RHIAZ|nr:hypothetical protein CU097_015577 [Rhizopus azygosporus]
MLTHTHLKVNTREISLSTNATIFLARQSSPYQCFSYDQTDVDVYDFATLRDELGAHEDVLLEDDDHLGDQLLEEGDINNDVTFADAPVDKDFDFSGNTQKFSANFKETGFTEEEAFFAKRRTKEESVNSSFRNIWGPSTNPAGHQTTVGRNFGEASPIASSKSIWGNFSSGLSTRTVNIHIIITID